MFNFVPTVYQNDDDQYFKYVCCLYNILTLMIVFNTLNDAAIKFTSKVRVCLSVCWFLHTNGTFDVQHAMMHI
jgi:hypothetical protein